MSTRNADVNLIIRAKTEGEKAISAMASAVDHLISGAGEGAKDVAELGRSLGALDKAASGLISAQDKVGASATKQAAAIHQASAGIAEQQERVETLRRGLGILATEADKAFVGPKRDGLADLIRTAKAEMRDAEGQLSRYTAAYDRNLTSLQSSRSGLLDLRRSTVETAEAQASAAAAIELNTQALTRQSAEAQRAAAAQRFFNNKGGPAAAPAIDNGAGYGALLDQHQRLEADQRQRDAVIRAAAIERTRAAAERAGGVDKIAATSQGATFSALNARALEEEAAAAERNEQAKRSAARAYEQFESRVRSGALALREEEDAAARDTAAIERLRAIIDPLGTIQNRLNSELAKYRTLAEAGKISTDDLAKAETHLATEAEQARLALDRVGKKSSTGLFGLKPYELQNLGYQVNDVFTQLASGTSLTQTLGQQGGQILQIFPRITSAIVGAFTNPAFLAAASVFIDIGLAMKRAADDAERLRGATALLNFRADGAGYDPKVVANQEKQFERLGASAEESRAAVKTLLDESVAPDKLAEFSRAAQATAEALGQKLPEAARSVAEAFTGGYDAIAKFDDQLNFLTADQREHIRTLFDQGKAEEARTTALNLYIGKQQELADKARGNFAGAAKELSSAWSDFMDLLSKTAVVQGFTNALSNLAGAARVALRDLNNMGDATGTLQQIADVRAQIATLTQQVAKNLGDKRANAELGDRQRALEILVARYNDLAKAAGKAQLAQDGTDPTAKAKPTGDTINTDPNSTAAKQRADDLRKIDVEDELQRLRDAGQSRILTKAEQARRAELAGVEASRSVADSVVAAAERRRAVAHETAAIERETDARIKSNAAEREKAIRSYLNSIVAAEGGTGPNRAGSSATGAGQFTRGTFVGLYKKINPGTQLNDDQIADLRKDSQTALRVLEVFTRDNARLIERAGKEVNAANLYLIHFLGAGTGGAALRAASSTPIDQIINRVDPNAAAVKSQNAGYLRTERGKGRYRTVGELQSFLGARAGDNPGSRAQTAIIADEAKLIEDARQKQDAFNTSVRHGVEDRQRAVDTLKAETGLFGTALLAEQRRQAVAKAELELRQRAENANKGLQPGETPVVVTPEQVEAEKAMAGALFDQQNAREALNALRDDAQRPIDNLTAERDLLREQAEYLRSIGDFESADDLDRQFDALGGKIRDAYGELIKFYEALTPAQRVELGIVDQGQLDAIIGKLRQAQTQTQEWGKVAGLPAREIAQAFASAAAGAFTNFINKVAAGKNVFKSLAQGVREFAANFISSIAQMIVQLLAFSAAVTVLRALGVPIPAGALSVGSSHTGGIAGGGTGQRRTVSPMLFAGAQRFHKGGIVGLAPDEVPIIAQKNEEILTAGNPRHRNNIGSAAANDTGRNGDLTVINVADHDAAVQAALRRPAGERLLFNFLQENSAAVKAALA
jgi:hypothetical protein